MPCYKLDTPVSSLVVRHSGMGLSMEHIGGAMVDIGPELAWSKHRDAVVPHGELDRASFNEFVTSENGLPNPSPDLIIRRDGKKCFVTLSVTAITESSNSLCVVLEDAAAFIRVQQILTATDSGVFKQVASVQNTGTETLAVEWLSAGSLCMSDEYDELLSFRGFWANEFQHSRTAVDEQITELASARGRSSHHAHPTVALGSRGFDEETGHVLLATFAYSGSYRMRAFRGGTGDIKIQAGRPTPGRECVLQANERMQQPPMLFAFSAAGLNGIREQFHQYWRSERAGSGLPIKPRLVHFNSWEACYFAQSESSTCALIDEAATLGAERFVLDDGWMRDRSGPGAGLGDWQVDEKKYPQGLRVVREYAKAQGLQFGLWLEPEMVTQDSELAKRHPEWLVTSPNGLSHTGRGQQLLNLRLPEVFTYVLSMLHRVMREANPDYIKWDMNRDIADAGFAENVFHSQLTDAFYQLLHRFKSEHPQIEVEICAAGGARADAGSMAYADRLWPSDSMDALQRIQVLRNASCFLPPETLGWHIGSARSETSGLTLPISTRCALATLGHMGIELNPGALNDKDRTTVTQWVSFFKQHRDWLSNARYQFLNTPNAEQDRLLVHKPDGSCALLYVLQREHPSRGTTSLLRLPVRPGGRHRIRLLNPGDSEFAQQRSPWHDGESRSINGDVLANAGLRLPFLQMGHAAVVLIEQRG